MANTLFAIRSRLDGRITCEFDVRMPNAEPPASVVVSVDMAPAPNETVGTLLTDARQLALTSLEGAIRALTAAAL